MQLREHLESSKAAIVDRWTDLALQVYPLEAARIMRQEQDRFQNPVGRNTRASLEALYDGLLAGRPAEEMTAALDEILRIRAVQDLSPSAAVEFLFQLKQALSETLGSDRKAELSTLDGSIERLALVAFDVFIRCREKIYELRIREIKRNASLLYERMKDGVTDGRDEATDCGTCEQVKGGCGA